MSAPAQATASRLARAAQAWIVLSTILTLPMDLFDPVWLGLFTLPGIAFLYLSTGPRETYFGFSQRLAICVGTVIALSAGIYQTGSTPVPQAALTYLLLSPLAYATLRSRPLDVLHSLFLAFCLLVISSILNGSTPAWMIMSFVAGAAVILQSEARRMATSARAGTCIVRNPLVTRLGQHASVAIACLLAFAGIFGLLETLPLPRAKPTRPAPVTTVGVSSQFDLSDTEGGTLGIVRDRLVLAHAPRGVPRNLYLRYSYFDIAGIDRWTTNQRRRTLSQNLSADPLRSPHIRGLRTQILNLTRVEDESGLVYTPPGTFEIAGPLDVVIRPGLESYFEPHPSGRTSYRVRYQDLVPLAPGRAEDYPVTGLTDLPQSLIRRDDYVALMREFVRDAGSDPAQIARAISTGLQQRCAYALESPRGDSPHALDNFLFGNNRGYCMHFASALAIFLRLADVPCRIAAGLYGGSEDENDPGVRVFGSQHAHAWVEIPLEGLGWIPFDATPPSTLLESQTLLSEPATRGTSQSIAEDETPSVATAWDWLATAVPLSTVAPWLALTAILLGATFRPRISRRDPTRTMKASTETIHAQRLLQRILTTLSDNGHPRRGQTLEHYAAELGTTGDFDDVPAIQSAFAAYQEVRFGKRSLDDLRKRALEFGLTAASRTTSEVTA